MALEVERKFLVADDSWRDASRERREFRQGYLARSDGCAIRVRLAGNEAWLTIKANQPGSARSEFEYAIPHTDAISMLDEFELIGEITKVRYWIEHGAHVWEVDEFSGDNAGLIVAEIELGQVGERFESPTWLGEEVTEEARFYNANLATAPFSTWTEPERRRAMAGTST